MIRSITAAFGLLVLAAAPARAQVPTPKADDIGPKLSQIMEEVEGEAIVVVDQDDHVPPLCQGFTVPPEGGQAARCDGGY